MINYINKIWQSRFFWTHLALADLRVKFRRSRLGIVWQFLQPLMITFILAFVFGTIFKAPFKEFAPYVFSGIILWEFLVSSVVTGCNSIINGEAYIKQFKHPIVIYPLKQALVNVINFMISFIGLFLWILVEKPLNIPITIASLPLSLILFFMLSWPLAIISGFVNTKFRDFQQLIVLVLQLIYFASPVYFLPKLFIDAGMAYLVNYNPVTHILNLVRTPLLDGHFPSLIDYLYVISTIIILGIISVYKIVNEEKDLIFYL